MIYNKLERNKNMYYKIVNKESSIYQKMVE
nr:MAG TPA: hypothetical protein [Caudoviricetes sp.]